MLLTGRGAAAYTGHNDFVVRDRGSLGYFFTVTGEVSTRHYVSPGFGLYVHYIAARRKLLTEAFGTEAV